MARKNPRTVAALGFLAPISFSVLLVGASGDTELFEKPVISTVFKADE